jgi:hypothetical protein
MRRPDMETSCREGPILDSNPGEPTRGRPPTCATVVEVCLLLKDAVSIETLWRRR